MKYLTLITVFLTSCTGLPWKYEAKVRMEKDGAIVSFHTNNPHLHSGDKVRVGVNLDQVAFDCPTSTEIGIVVP